MAGRKKAQSKAAASRPNVPPPQSQPTLPAPVPAVLRDEYVDRISRDLLGPGDGPTERIRGSGGATRVRDRYLVGLLAPLNTVAFDEGRDDDNSAEGEAEEGDASFSERVQSSGTLFPSSIGLSCTVEGVVDELSVECRWGRYRKELGPEIHEKTGHKIPWWQREPCRHIVPVPLTDGPIAVGVAPHDQPGVWLRGRVEAITDASGSKWWLVTIFLVNEQLNPLQNKDEAWLFQVEFTVTAPGHQAPFAGRTEVVGGPTVPDRDKAEVAQLDMQYRDLVEFAVGHGTSVHCKPLDASPQRATSINTVTIPAFEVARTDAPEPSSIPELSGLNVDMKDLSELPADQLRSALEPLAKGYAAWLTREEKRLADGEDRLAGHEVEGGAAIGTARDVAAAIQTGIDRVCSDPDALEAFRYANATMWKQRIHSIAAGRRSEQARSGEKPDRLSAAVSAIDIPKNRSWRPFQLAFVLLNVPSLVEPNHPERSRPGLIDLLYFPTGGGKTEAYLGLVAFTFAIRRLQGGITGDDDNVYEGNGGMAVFMRYTLRLLTSQQIQRAAALVCAAEQERQQRATSDSRYASGDPIRLGMWVGGGVSQNRIDDAAEAIREAHDRGRVYGASPKQLVSCPWCGTRTGAQDLTLDSDTRRALLYCPDTTGQCPFTAAKAPGEGIPLVTVDDDIYRLLPAFVIATVDKFAQVPWEPRAKLLFGQVERRCSRHGFRHPDTDKRIGCTADTHPKRGNRPAASTSNVNRFRPPDLILQDELHLITGPLGTMVGLYETAIDKLSSWDVGGHISRPKVVASTATIRRARDQGYALFWRNLRVFPPPVLEASRQFFAEQTPTSTTPGRLYLGICARGIRLKQVQVRAMTAILAAGFALWNRYGAAADPYLTAVGYFNTLRELAGMRRMADDELRALLQRQHLWSPSVDPRFRLRVEELTSRVQSSEIPEALDRLGTSFDPSNPQANPIDLLLATNMLSVGVDVPRLGCMVVVGQPKQTAEYIQATSRVGRERDKPGVVVTLYNWARPRDVSHYETFEHYHATFYRRVEPLSVTPFSPRALDRALTAVLVSEARHLPGAFNLNRQATDFDRFSPLAADLIVSIKDRGEEVTGKTTFAIELDGEVQKRYDGWQQQIVDKAGALTYRRISGGGNTYLLRKPEEDPAWGLWTLPNSLRETEPNVNLIIESHRPSAGWRGAEPDFPPAPPPKSPEDGDDDAEAADVEDMPADTEGLEDDDFDLGADNGSEPA